MSFQKTKSLQNIEDRMIDLDPNSFRFKALDCAKSFKSSWIQLGQYLFTIYKDKLFKDWGYLTFEAYCSKEVGIRQNTAMKLLKSYSFIEKEKPSFLKQETIEDRKPSQIPGFEAVNALRLAKESKRLPQKDYAELEEAVFESPKEESEVKKKIKYVLKSYAPPPSAEKKEEERAGFIQRSLSSLKNTREGLEEHGLPKKLIKQIDELIDALAEFQE